MNQLDKYEYSIYDIFALYFGKDMIFYIDQDQDKFIKISKLESIIEINGANFDNKLKLNDLHALEPGLKEHFSHVEKKINEYYEELNEKS